MALELTSLVFKTETSDLERASKVIGELVTNVGKLDKAARDAAQTEVVLAKAAKLNADANLQNAKAQDQRLKSTITADKADQQAAASIEKKAKATEKATEASAKNVGVLQRQKDILEFQTQGFSRGQSSILSYGKAAGLAAADISELGKVLETQRKLMGVDPFDKSLSGIKSLQNQYTELKESVRQYATDSNLTAKQTRELARDKERLIEKMKVEGASFSEIRKAVRAHNAEYVNLATSYNKMISAEDAVIKSRKEAVNATNYLTQAEAKMAAALNTSNAALDKAGTDSLVKYESALRKSGVSQDVATQKLATYKSQLAQVAAAEEKRRAQHLTRALTPQISDVAVSLWSGQSPLTVLLQQGAQINDMFQLSGVAAADFGKTVKEAFSSMLPSILTVVKGVGGLLVDGLIAAGNAAQGFIAGIFGMTGAMDKFYMKLSENGPSKFGGMIQAASSIMTGVFAVGVGVVIAGLAMMAKGAYDSMIAVSDLNKAMVLGGNAFNMTGAQALAYADTLSGANTSTLGIIEVMTEMSKVGGFTADQIGLVSRAAIAMQDYAGVAIKDTVKQFSELGKDPVKALLELARKTGELTVEQIKSVEQLQKQGRAQDAVNLAMKISAGVMDKQSQSLRDQLHPLEKLVAGWKILGRWMWDVTNIAPGTSDALELINKKERLAKSLAAGVSENVPENVALKQEIALLEAKTLTQAQSAANRQAVKDEAAAYQQFSGALSEFDKQLNKADASKMKRQDFINAKIQELGVLENAGKYESTTLNTDRIKQFFKVYGEEWDKAQEKLGSKEANYYATLMREATNNTIAANTAAQELTKSEQKLLEVRSDPRFEKLTATQKQDVISKYEAAIAAEKQTSLTEKLAEAEEHRLKLLGKSEGIGKQYYSDMQKLEEFAKVAGWSREEIEELTRAIFMATPAWKAYEKALEEVNSAARKFNEDSIASQAATLKENQSLDYRLSLLGKTTEEQKALSIEYNRANKISEVRIKLAKQLRDIEADIEKAKKAGLPEEKYKNLIDAQVQARKDAAEQEKVINREVAVQYAEDLQKEFDAIKSGISDSIVTALFEGGKSGSKKFRDLVVAALRKPVTMVVNAVVNTVLGNILGSLMGGAAAGAAGGAAGGIAGSIGSSIAGSAIMSGIGMMGAEVLANIVGFLGGDALGVLGAGASGGFSSAIASAIGQIPVWGWIAGGLFAVASLFDDGSGTPHTGGAASYSVATGQRNSLGFRDNEEGLPSYNPRDNIDNQFGTGFGYVDRSDQTISAMEQLSKSLVEIFDGIAKTFGKTVGYEVAVAFADDSSEDGAWGAFAVRLQGVEILNWEDFRQSKWAPKEFGDGEEGYKQYLAAIAKDTRQVILDMDLPGWADKVLNDIGDSPSLESLSKAIQELAQMKAVYDLMTSQMVNFAGITDEAFGKLIKEFGDIGTMTNQVAGYYQNYYSEFERFNKAQADVTKSFTDLGLTMPTSREEFRKLAESQDLNTEAGRKMYAQLMALAASFGVVIDATEQLANARTDINYRMMEQEAQLLAAQGRTVEADKKRRELLDKQRAAEYERLMKINPELARLTAELWALEDAAVAAAKVKEIADTRQDLIDRILQQEAQLLDSQGRTAEADKKRRELLDRQRARENERLMALSPELARLAYELWLLEDAAAAAALRTKKINERYSQLQKAVEAEKKVLNERIATSQELINTLTTIFDTVSGAVKELYNQVDSTAAMSFQSAKSYISGVFNSVVQGGGIGDSKLLTTAVEDAMAGLSANNYRTKADYDRERLRLAGQLALIRDNAEESLTNEQKVLKGLKNQVDKLDETLAYWKDMIDIANGTYVATVSVTQAVNQLTELIRTVTSPDGKGEKPRPKPVGTEKPPGGGTGNNSVFGGGGGGSGGITYDSNGNVVYPDGRIGYRNWYRDVAGILHWGYVSKSIWEEEYARGTPGYGNPPAFAKGGNYRGGLALVGEEGPELINFNQGGYVHTASQTASMLSGNSGLEARIANLERAAVNTANALTQIANNTKRTADTLRNISPAGDSIQVESESFLEI